MKFAELLENYLISENGVIKNKKTGRVIKLFTNPKGYKITMLSDRNVSKTFSVHRLVYTKFVGEIPKGYEINHIDGDKTNNHYTNLESLTHHDNILHAVKIGLIKSGFDSKLSKHIAQVKYNGEIVFYGSTHEAARALGKNPANISLCANGRRKTAYGCVWIHVNKIMSK